MYRKRKRRGFTLLELMIVLVILVALFALVGPRLLGSQEKADLKTAATQIGNLEAALEMFKVDARRFPSTEDGLAVLIDTPTDERLARQWAGPYLDDELLPMDPWDNPFHYEYPPSQGKRDFPNIFSAGPDGEPNTNDDVINWRRSAETGAETEDAESIANAPVEDLQR